MKLIIVDGKKAFMGSANLTGAGMGMKSKNTRNFETGLYTDDKEQVKEISDIYDNLWMGSHCKSCRRKSYCAESLEN